MGQTSIRFKLDTGANANVIPYQTYLRVPKSDGNKGTVAPISSTRSILTGIGNGKIRPRGLTQLHCTVVAREGQSRKSMLFYVTDEELVILGGQACQELDLIRRVNQVTTGKMARQGKEELLSVWSDVFKGIGLYQREYHIRLDDTTPPVIQPSRTFPYPKQQKLKKTLDTLEKTGVIASVDKPTEWVHNLVVTE